MSVQIKVNYFDTFEMKIRFYSKVLFSRTSRKIRSEGQYANGCAKCACRQNPRQRERERERERERASERESGRASERALVSLTIFGLDWLLRSKPAPEEDLVCSI